MSQPPPSPVARSAERGPQSAVCAGISALVRERWGRGPSRSRAYWAGPDMLLVLLEDAHTESERTLMAQDHAGDVLAGRRLLGELAEPDLRRIVESATGRKVLAVLSQSHLEPAISTHVFVCEPNGEPLGETIRHALENTDSARALMAEGAQARRHSAESRARLQAERVERRRGRTEPRDEPG